MDQKALYGVASAPHLQRLRPTHMLTQSNQLDQLSENLQKRFKCISSTTHRAPAKEVLVTKCSQLYSHIREAGLIQLLILTGHLYLTGALLSLGLKRTPKRHVFQRAGTTCSKFVNILDSIVNIMGVWEVYVPKLWLPLHSDSRRAPNFSAIEPDFSVHNADQPDLTNWSCINWSCIS